MPARPPSPADPRPAKRRDHQLGVPQHFDVRPCHQRHRGPDRSLPVEQVRRNVHRRLSVHPNARRWGDPLRHWGDRNEHRADRHWRRNERRAPSVDQRNRSDHLGYRTCLREPRACRLGLLGGHRELLDGHRGFRNEVQSPPGDHSNARRGRAGRQIGRDVSHALRRRLPSRLTPTRDVRLGSGMDQKLGGVASRQPIGPDGGQNPRTLPENEKRTPEGVLFL